MSKPKSNSTPRPSFTTPTLSSRLSELVQAAFSAIWLQTHEPAEATRDLTALCRSETWRLATWDCDRGMTFPLEPVELPGVNDTQDPLAVIRALPQVSIGAATTLVVFESLHRFLGATEIIRALVRQIHHGKSSRCFVVVLAPVIQIPAELEKLFTVIDHELPNHNQLEWIAREVATEPGELPTAENLPRVIEAAAGLTRSEAENAFSLSLVRHGTLEPETMWELKS